MSSTPQTHLLAYPFPSFGHVILLIDLTKCLVFRNIHITVLLTPSTQHLVPTNYSPLLQTLLLPQPQFPDPNQNRLITILSFMRQHHYPILLDWARLHPLPPSAIISDFFLGWTHLLARNLHVPRILFSPSGASTLSICFSLWRDQELLENDNTDDPDSIVFFPALPNSPFYPSWQITNIFKEKKGEPEIEIINNYFQLNLEAWGVVFNSFIDLEPAFFHHIKNELGHKRVWAVGPVLPLESGWIEPEERCGFSTVSSRDLTTWLNQFEDHSVVYVCFGSRTILTTAQMEVLSSALELSGVHFILSVTGPDERHGGHDCGVIPSGFIERVKGRALVIEGWAPQLVILSHRAVGSFLTHCGWNSVLEGLVSGVVMLTWPMGADQYTNAKLLVDQLGVAVRVAEGNKKVPEISELSEMIKGSLGRLKERVRAEELRDAALGAIQKNGSSYKQLDALVKDLNELKNE